MTQRRLYLFPALLLALPLFAQGQTAAIKAEKLTLAKLEKSYTSSKASFIKNKKSPALKKAYVAATVKLGTATMNAQSLGPKVKYVRALHLYREALANDPSNKEAKKNRDLIESIYRSMGRPIPK